MIEEPLVIPFTPGAALERLSQVRGVLAKEPAIADLMPGSAPENLTGTREALLLALESGDQTMRQDALAAAQKCLRQIYEALAQPGLFAEEEAAEKFAALGFPDPLQEGLRPVEIDSVLATFSRPERQIFTTIAFDHSPGAIGYRLRETRVVAGEDFVDDTLESPVPVFRRVRMPVGSHRLSIESRNHSYFVVSEEFTVVVPEQV